MNEKVYSCRWFDVAPTLINVIEDAESGGTAVAAPELFALGICSHPLRWRQAEIPHACGLPGPFCWAMVSPLDPRLVCEHCELLNAHAGRVVPVKESL